MNLEILYILGSFLVSLGCGFALIPPIVSFCKRHNLYDLPNVRKVHKCGIPRLGGICFVPSMLLAFLIAMSVFNNVSSDRQITFSLWSLIFFISIALIYCVGLLDDLIGLSPKAKFAVQVVAASLLPWSMLYINDLYGFLGIHAIPYWAGFPLTVFAIVFIDNAINLIDGIDGLSSGLAVLALGGFLVCFYNEGIWLYCVLIAGLMGVLLAFMYYNLFAKADKNKIFMGDSGSLSVGFILSFLFVKLSMDTPNATSIGHSRLLMAYTFLIVPCFDVVRVTLVRLIHRRPVFEADKNHIHHKLMRMGMSQHQALIAILSLAVLFIVLNCLLLCRLNINVILLTDVAIWIAAQQAVNHYIRKKGKEVFYRAE